MRVCVCFPFTMVAGVAGLAGAEHAGRRAARGRHGRHVAALLRRARPLLLQGAVSHGQRLRAEQLLRVQAGGRGVAAAVAQAGGRAVHGAGAAGLLCVYGVCMRVCTCVYARACVGG